MYCPNCGMEDQSQNQFCRGCGTSLHTVRSALEHPDAITTSAVTAREEIGRAVAAKISEFEKAHELRQAVYEILPAIDKFLVSPEERRLNQGEQRLNQIREGTLTSLVGLAIIIPFLLISWIIAEPKILIVSALGLGVLLIGLGIIVTALWFSGIPSTYQNTSGRMPRQLEGGDDPESVTHLKVPPTHSAFGSITEGTTREL